MKRAQRKDFFREIGQSRNRFLSILLITALGVAFYAGVRSAEPDMRLTVDGQYDEANFMDIRVVSTLGLTGEDLEAVRQVPGVRQAEPGMRTEAVCKISENDTIMEVFSLGQEINQVQMEEGRLPEKSGECYMDTLMIRERGLQIGDTVTLEAGTSLEDGEKEDILDTLETDTYTIVGCGSYPGYLNWNRGTASIGDGKIDGFIGIRLEDFCQDPEAAQAPVYHMIYATVDGAQEENSFLADYEDKVDEAVSRIEDIAGERCEIRYQAVREDGERKLADARQEIADGEQEIADAEAELEDAGKELADGEAELADGRKELEDGRQEIVEAEQKLEDGWKEYKDGLAQIEEKKADVAEAEAQLEEGRKELDEQADALAAGRKEYEDGLAQLEAAQLELDARRVQLEQAEEQFFAGFAAQGMTDREQVLAYVSQDPELSAQYQKIAEGMEALTAGEQELAAGQAELAASGQELEQGEALLEEAGRDWQDGWNKMKEGKQELEKARRKLEDAKTELEQGEKELAEAKEELKRGEAELADGEAELADGRSEYEDKKAEAEAELADARQEIADAKTEVADAEKELAELEMPEWLILKRSDSVQTFIEYGLDADRIGAIGKVFPALFFLVAALVCLTTMTRMVEEERTQIGTLKALGYSKGSIASKYILYALSACLAGGVLGVLIGSRLFPYVIMKAYQILYTNTPEPRMPLHANLVVSSILIAVCCTVFAAAMSCYRELAGTPAELMRPAAPKQGKRVLLERVTFIWKHLNFTWKATMRNLFRYKKRLFMTIFGIGGSMALLMVGFGLRDSIQEIVNKQYKTLWTYDAYLSLNEDKSNEEKLIYEKQLAESEEGVEETLCVRTIAMDVEKSGVTKNANLFVPDRMDGLEDFLVLKSRLTDERYELEDGGVIISEKLSRLLDAKAGDTFYLVRSETEKYPVTVTAVVENYLYHYVYMTNNTYEQIFDETPKYNQLFLKLGDLDTRQKEELSERLLEEETVRSVTYVEEMQDKVAGMMRSLDMVIVVLILAAALLAFVVLYNLNNISIMERRRELATLKVLGFYDMEVAEYVYRENIFLTCFGIAAGVILGLLLHQFVIRTCEIDMIMFGRTVKPLSYLFSILLTILFAAIVNLGMFYNLRKIDMVESLKNFE